MDEQTSLQHYGVKGMRWGVRRNRNKTSRRERWSDDYKATRPLRRKKVKELSNAELRKLNERLQLEQQYSNLHPSVAKRGAKAVSKAIGLMGTAVTVYNNADRLMKIGKTVMGK